MKGSIRFVIGETGKELAIWPAGELGELPQPGDWLELGGRYYRVLHRVWKRVEVTSTVMLDGAARPAVSEQVDLELIIKWSESRRRPGS